MGKILSTILAVTVCLLAFRLHSQSSTLQRQSLTIADLQQKQSATDLKPASAIETRPVTGSLEDQGKCAKQAAETFKADWGSKKGFPSPTFQSHYSAKLGRCFVRENVTEMYGHVPSNSAYIVDAFENKTLGKYLWMNTEGKQYWEVAPKHCTVTLPTGEEEICHSSDEFDELSKAYME